MILSVWLVTCWMITVAIAAHVRKSHELLNFLPRLQPSLSTSGREKARSNSVRLDSSAVWDDDSNSTFYGSKISETFVYNAKFRRIHDVDNSSTCHIVERNLNTFIARVLSEGPFPDFNVWQKLRSALLVQYYNNSGVIVYNQRDQRWTFFAKIAWKLNSKMTKFRRLSNRLQSSSLPLGPQQKMIKSRSLPEFCHVRISCALSLLEILLIKRSPIEGEDYIPLTKIAQLLHNTTLNSTLNERPHAKIEGYLEELPIKSRYPVHSSPVRDAVLVDLSIIETESYSALCKHNPSSKFTRMLSFPFDSDHIAH